MAEHLYNNSWQLLSDDSDIEESFNDMLYSPISNETSCVSVISPSSPAMISPSITKLLLNRSSDKINRNIKLLKTKNNCFTNSNKNFEIEDEYLTASTSANRSSKVDDYYKILYSKVSDDEGQEAKAFVMNSSKESPRKSTVQRKSITEILYSPISNETSCDSVISPSNTAMISPSITKLLLNRSSEKINRNIKLLKTSYKNSEIEDKNLITSIASSENQSPGASDRDNVNAMLYSPVSDDEGEDARSHALSPSKATILSPSVTKLLQNWNYDEMWENINRFKNIATEIRKGNSSIQASECLNSEVRFNNQSALISETDKAYDMYSPISECGEQMNRDYVMRDPKLVALSPSITTVLLNKTYEEVNNTREILRNNPSYFLTEFQNDAKVKCPKRCIDSSENVEEPTKKRIRLREDKKEVESSIKITSIEKESTSCFPKSIGLDEIVTSESYAYKSNNLEMLYSPVTDDEFSPRLSSVFYSPVSENEDFEQCSQHIYNQQNLKSSHEGEIMSGLVSSKSHKLDLRTLFSPLTDDEQMCNVVIEPLSTNHSNPGSETGTDVNISLPSTSKNAVLFTLDNKDDNKNMRSNADESEPKVAVRELERQNYNLSNSSKGLNSHKLNLLTLFSPITDDEDGSELTSNDNCAIATDQRAEKSNLIKNEIKNNPITSSSHTYVNPSKGKTNIAGVSTTLVEQAVSKNNKMIVINKSVQRLKSDNPNKTPLHTRAAKGKHLRRRRLFC